jgi:hypothetical protein
MARQECSHVGALPSVSQGFCVQHTPDRINGRICEIEVFSFFPSIVPLDNSIA